ncbi:MAG: bifunctional phosphoribosyl-AMP cyclohydrolase/phosphoribosyl-ATP diphosphatase HisIE [Oscillospiraceae bacterium]|nr:bifunctional phosphoribosyl-AMP cyclohydrolase/phosphoribosyl-ATP diphosphatase HisIE [Oscillospiraceae bacterium]
MDKKKLFAMIELCADGQGSLEAAEYFDNNGADGLLIADRYTTDAEHDRNIGYVREIARNVDAPLFVFGGIRRLEDVKKYLYAGAKKAVLDMDRESNRKLLKEASDRFGKEKIAVSVSEMYMISDYQELMEAYASVVLFYSDDGEEARQAARLLSVPVLPIGNYEQLSSYMELLREPNICGAAGSLLLKDSVNLYSLKSACREEGIPMSIMESAYSWKDFKLNSDGMIPVVVQDYRTLEVLMVAYMNEEAYEMTISTGKMTYWSRSRNELWVKGDTSGHYQYVKSLTLDCDLDTILAKVHQIGAACHTGSYSCFFNEAAYRDGQTEHNPLKVFEEVYQVIRDRKEHPKEGSYTNYLFDKGIDKILKKVGEEATEIVIAAKNPDPEEIKYEVSDFLYHVMVLMVERGVTWDDITRELAQR